MPVTLQMQAEADVSDAVAAFHTVGGAADGAGKAFEESGKAGGGMLGKITGGLGGLVGLVNPVGLATTAVTTLGPALLRAGKAADAENTEIAQLTNTLKNSVKDWDGNTAAIDDAVAAGQRKAFVDSDVRASLGLLATDTGNVEEAIRLQGIAMDLAASKGISLEQATKLIGKADDGSYAALAKLGIEIQKGTTREAALAAIHEKTAGAADVFANSAEGAGIRLQSGMGDAMETIGSSVAPLLNTGMGLLADTFTALSPVIGAIASILSTILTPALNVLKGLIPPIQAAITPLVGAFTSLSSGAAPLPGFLEQISGLFDQIGIVLAPIGGVIQSVITAFGAEGLGGAFGALSEAAPTVLTALQQVGFTIADQATDWIIALVSWVGDAIPGIVTGLGQFGAAIFTWITTEGIPQAADFLMGLAQKFIDWIMPALPGMLQKLQEWGTGMLNWILNEGIPQAVNALVTLGTKFVEWIGPQIPGMLQELGTLGASLIGWVTGTATPMIISKLIEWATAFVAWIGPNIPPMLQKLGELLGAIGTWLINTALPDLIANLSKWGQEFINWVGPQIPPLLQKLGELAGAIWNWLTTDAIPNAITKLGEFAKAFIDWVGPQIPPLLVKLGEFAGAVWNWLTTVAVPTAITKLGELGKAFIDWVGTDALPFIGAKLTEFGNAIWTWVTNTAVPAALAKLKEVGASMIEGIKSGLEAGKDAVINFIKGIAAGAVDAIKDFFGIHSPSRVMIDLFGPNGVTGGMVAGLDQGAGAVLRKATALQRGVVDALGGKAGLALGLAGSVSGGGTAATGSGARSAAVLVAPTGAGAGGDMALTLTLMLPNGDTVTRDVRLSNRKAQERIDLRTASYHP